MPVLEVGPSSAHELQLIADALGKSKKVVVVTGAGISTSCGIPDFRSDDGLYSLIQAQYDAALKDPPWEQSNTFDIDDRPKKKRKNWFFEVVAPDGTVVDVIDDEPVVSGEPQPEPVPRSSSQSRSTDTTTSNSRSSTPDEHSSDESSLSSCPSLLSNPSSPELDRLGAVSSQKEQFCSAPIQEEFIKIHQGASEQLLPHRKGSRSPSPCSDLESTITALPATTSPTQSKPYSFASSLTRKTRTPLPCSAFETKSSSLTRPPPVLDPEASPAVLRRADSSNISSTTVDEASVPQSSQTSTRSLPNLKGRDLFDCMVWNNPFTTSIFYMFISSLREKVQQVAHTSETHKFIRVLRDGERLVRTYTQNIDLLEAREGLSTDLSLGPGSRNRFSQRSQRLRGRGSVERHSTQSRGVECVPLHGDLDCLRCVICSRRTLWNADRQTDTLSGAAPECPDCLATNNRRTSANRRGLAVGRLRPNIVLYGEEHPDANLISPLITHDLNLGPDILLIMGTSLKVHGLKVMVREFAKAVHNKGGKVVFVNNTKPSESAWGDVIDYWIAWDCDQWVLDLKTRRRDIWYPQDACKEVVKKKKFDDAMGAISKPSHKPARPQCKRDDKINGAYMTLKILDTLAGVLDLDGKRASRPPYWVISTTKQSNNLSVDTQVLQKLPQSAVKLDAGTSSAKSKPLRTEHKEKQNLKKRKSQPSHDAVDLDDKEILAVKMKATWLRLREENPTLAALNLEMGQPLSKLVSMPELFTTSFPRFPFNGESNHFTNVGGTPSLAGMNLKSLPPSGTTITVQQPKVISRPTTNHSYGTRASRILSAAGERGSDEDESGLLSAETLDIHVVNGSMTSSSQRIKKMSSIGTVLSPEVEEWHDAVEDLPR